MRDESSNRVVQALKLWTACPPCEG